MVIALLLCGCLSKEISEGNSNDKDKGRIKCK
jgi:hypothetical protein